MKPPTTHSHAPSTPTDPLVPPSPSTAPLLTPSAPLSPLLPPPRHPALPDKDAPPPAIQAQLDQLYDQEIQQLLERVGDQLDEVRLRHDADEEDDSDIIWPEKEAFRRIDGTLDRVAYLTALSLVLLTHYVPTSLLTPTPRQFFSFRALLTSLERFYILLPPSSWQPALLHTLPSLYRWDNPALTLRYLAAYFFLVYFDLVPLAPILFLTALLARARLAPPSPLTLLREASARKERSAEAHQLGRQLAGAGRFGVVAAGEGVRGVWSEVRERVGRRKGADGEESDEEGGEGGQKPSMLARAVAGSTALSASFGGRAGGEHASAVPSLPQLRRRASVSTSSVASEQAQAEDSAKASPDPAAGTSDGDVSLYRLARNLSKSFGPQVQLWAEEMVELGEGIKNILSHPSHPSAPRTLARLTALCLVLAVLPAWALLKLVWVYLGVEFFLLWWVRERWPEWRRATMVWWWIFLDAPTDAEFALWLLRERSKEGRPLRGSKTLRRAARADKKEGNLGKLPFSLPRSTSSPSTFDTASLLSTTSASTSTSKPSELLGSYFALHASTPGQLRLTRTTLSFTPTRKLRHLGELASRLSSSSPSSFLSSSSSSVASSAESASTASASAYVPGARLGVELDIKEVRAVRKEQGGLERLGSKVGEGLVVTTGEGVVYRFTNVAKRDECFMKLLSVSEGTWETVS
ncbi:hypothetical protein JCM10207_000440 [Rhodosporidiobolus poonsookiae]